LGVLHPSPYKNSILEISEKKNVVNKHFVSIF